MVGYFHPPYTGRQSLLTMNHIGDLEVSMALVPNPGMYQPTSTTTRVYQVGHNAIPVVPGYFHGNTMQLLSMTNTLSIEGLDERNPTREQTIPFFFDVPSYCSEPVSDPSRCCSDRHERHPLPPSMQLQQTPSNVWMSEAIDGGSTLRLSECRIKYYVTSKVWKDGKIIANASKEWKYIPTAEAAPPIPITDFPGEYQLSAKTFAANVRRLRIYGLLNIQIEQPRPVLITRAEMTTGAQVVIPTKLRIRNSEEPDIIDCKCELSLESYTFCSTICQGATLPRLHKLPLLAIAERSKRTLQECGVPTLPWRRMTGNRFPCHLTTYRSTEDAVIDKQGPYWVADIDITAVLQKRDLPVPTFSVGFVSARHTLVMVVKPLNKMGHGAAPSFNLRAPLQIAYGPRVRDFEENPGSVSHQRNDLVYASIEDTQVCQMPGNFPRRIARKCLTVAAGF